MRRGGYRDRLDDLELEESHKDIMMGIINEIERDVTRIQDELVKYRNLSEISEIYDLAYELSEQLY